MSKLLEDLKFQTLRKFLSNYNINGLPEIADYVYIRAREIPSVTSFNSTLKSTELITRAIKILLSKNQDNHLCTGYIRQSSSSFDSNAKIVCYAPNTSLNIFKSHDWSCLMHSIGDELMLFLFTKCSIVQIIDGSYVFLAGDFRSLHKAGTEKGNDCISRNVIFHKHVRKIEFRSCEVFEHIFSLHNPEKYRAIQSGIKMALEDVERLWKKLFLNSVFESYFKEELITEKKSSILECSVEPTRLVNFLFAISKKLFKNIFDAHAFRIFKSKISILIHRNRYESISRNEMLKYFKISRFKFFRNPKCNRHEFVFRSTIASRFLIYIIDKLFIPIISKYFYSTETSFSRFKVYYFPRPSWRYFSNIYIEMFLDNFDCIRKEKVDVYSEIRCIPKRNGARAVVNMSKSRDKRPSINRTIYPEFCILKEECYDKLGNSVLGYSEMYERLASYLTNSTDPLYILKLDISDCFDNIPQDEIIKLVKGLFSKDRYCTKTFSILEKAYGELKYRQICKVIEGVKPINVLMKHLKFSNNKIVKENVNQRILLKEKMEESINKLIKKNIVKHNGKFFIQRTGIAQGSVLSTLLCSLYYSSIDSLYFNNVFKMGILVRYVDDFLIVTPSINEIIRFLEMSESISHLGINFSRKKIESNFGIEEYLKRSVAVGKIAENADKLSITNKPVTWCGSKIYSTGFAIKPYVIDPYFSFSVAHSCTKPGKALISKMKNLLRNKTSIMYINTNNRKQYENIYEAFFFYGKKLVLFFGRMDFVNRLFAERILRYSKDLIYRICRKREIRITKRKIEEIASKAFIDSGVDELVACKRQTMN